MLTEIRLIAMIALWVMAIFGGIVRKRGHKQLADRLIAIFDIGVRKQETNRNMMSGQLEIAIECEKFVIEAIKRQGQGNVPLKKEKAV